MPVRMIVQMLYPSCVVLRRRPVRAFRRQPAVAMAIAFLVLIASQGGRSAAAEPVARFASEIDIPRSAAWVGGFSGLELADNGIDFHAISDRGALVRGKVSRERGTALEVSFTEVQPILNRFGVAHSTRFADAEGLAVAADGRIFISFETEDRVSVYNDFYSPERLAGFTQEWRVFPDNKGLEALAIRSDGSLWAFAEFVRDNGSQVQVYQRPTNGEWGLTATIPTNDGLVPVGADFGPDGRLYLLERGLFTVGFFSRVRRLTLDGSRIMQSETILRTIPGRHGNLEGLAVWEDSLGQIRLTMISDDNFQFLQRNQLVEYVVEDGLAPVSE